MPDLKLPARERTAESAFVEAWAQAADPAPLSGVISDALAARRPKLAARLVNLLTDDQLTELDDPNLRRARAAARLLLLADAPSPESVEDLEAAWRVARSAWMRRVRSRIRRSGSSAPVLGVASTTPGRRGPRRR